MLFAIYAVCAHVEQHESTRMFNCKKRVEFLTKCSKVWLPQKSFKTFFYTEL